VELERIKGLIIYRSVITGKYLLVGAQNISQEVMQDSAIINNIKFSPGVAPLCVLDEQVTSCYTTQQLMRKPGTLLQLDQAGPGWENIQGHVQSCDYHTKQKMTDIIPHEEQMSTLPSHIISH
jgi:hypothetical protein